MAAFQSLIRRTHTNFFNCLLQSGTNPDIFASRLLILVKYHPRDVHSWDEEKCDFHKLEECICGDCEGEDEVIRSIMQKIPLHARFMLLHMKTEHLKLLKSAWKRSF